VLALVPVLAPAADIRGAISQSPCDVPANAVVAENCLPGSPSSEWDVGGLGALAGFATDISVNRGETVHFKVTSTGSYSMTIYRMGYYGGMGARRVATVQPLLIRNQQPCLRDATTQLMDCGNWVETASWTVPPNAVSGIYLARLVSANGTDSSHIVFIVRDDANHSDLLFQTSDTTWQAYNTYGGGSLYTGVAPTYRAFKVSYNRPFETRDIHTFSWLFNAEYPMVRWLEANGYDISYFTGIDSDRRGALIKNHKVFLSVAHDEYWSGAQRSNVEAARAAGVHLAFFSGNEIFWKIRWENSVDGTNTPYRTLVSYKETHANQPIDPADPPTWTGTWRDPRFSPPADGGRPENALAGTGFRVNGIQGDAITVPAADGKMRFWRNTSIATLAPNTVATLPAGVLGYEWDEDPDNAFRPPGIIWLSSTTLDGKPILADYGSNYGTGKATHHLTLYRSSSGALVFGVGTVQWSWGLDSNHDRGNAPPDPRMQQATVNLFADMGAQPASLQAGLLPAMASTAVTPPSSNISSPATGSTAQSCTIMTVAGTAAAAGGGAVGGVDVSVDGGSTWHHATGRENWSYAWRPATLGTVSIKSRAVDDNGNIETPSAGITATVVPPTGPCSIWDSGAVPMTQAYPDSSSVELGIRFRSDVDGSITGIRFYKGSGNTGTHIGNLWTNTGALLARGTFTNETASGWQQLNFATPVGITANTTYVASYFAPAGNYAVDRTYFTTSVGSYPLHSVVDGPGSLNGIYGYSPTTVFPTQTTLSSNYWVDVVLTASAAPPPSPPPPPAPPAPGTCPCSIWSGGTTPGTQAFPDSNAVELGVRFRSDVDGAITGIRFYKGSGNTGTHVGSLWTDTGTLLARATFTNETASGWQQVSFATPVATTANTTYVASYFAPAGRYAVDRPYFLSSFDNPPLHALADSAGSPNGIYMYSPTSVFPTQTTLSSNYWVDVVFTATPGPPPPPAPPAPGTCPCSIWSGGTTPGTQAFPDSNAVELGVRFRSDVNGSIIGVRFYKGSGNTGTHIGNLWTNTGTLLASATFTNETASGWQQVNFAAPVGIMANTTYVASYFAPAGHYAVDRPYFANSVDSPPLHAAADGVGSPNGIYVYSPTSVFPTQTTQSSNYWVDVVFSTTPAPAPTPPPPPPPATCPCSIWSGAITPDTQAFPDSNAVELGVRFRSDVNGTITGLRFYKGSGNTGTHVGNLWTNTGTLLASASFTNETASGWQQVNFATPVAITANTIYVASYFAPVGHYAVDRPYFVNSVDSPPLHAVADSAGTPNGIYIYAASSAFPNQTIQSSNYWVDVVFRPPCPCSIWSGATTPGTQAYPDNGAVELGVRFRADVNGTITGIRFYKGSGNTGTHVGNLWTDTGTLLARAVFTNETASGWQQVSFATPVAITANTTYVASYFAPAGGYAVDRPYFVNTIDNPPLHAVADSAGTPNGVYIYAASSAFPNQTIMSSNYWVDVAFKQ